jgi:hypothetical protein
MTFNTSGGCAYVMACDLKTPAGMSYQNELSNNTTGHWSGRPPLSVRIVFRNDFNAGHCEAAIAKSLLRSIRFASLGFE